MIKIVDKHYAFNFSESYAYADKVRKAIFESDFPIDPLEVATNLTEQISKPTKWTLLHDYISYVICEDLEFHFRGGGWDYDDVIPIFSMLDSHGIEYQSLIQYVENRILDDDIEEIIEVTDELLEKYKYDYASEHLEEIVMEHLVSKITNEVFTLLFSDREAMKTFNSKIADSLGARTGRCTYWPEWLKRALFCREKGLCALCKTDLTALHHVNANSAIDHIVPIALNGINDPTNLQLLCAQCNLKKSGKDVVTSNALPVFW